MMALALGEAILSQQGRMETVAMAQAFDRWMQTKPIDIGHTVRRGILHFRQTGVPEMPPSEDSAGNGAAMRLLPVALACFGKDEMVTKQAIEQQAHITHNHPLSDLACHTLALMVQDFLHGHTLVEVLHQRAHPLASQQPLFGFRGKRQIGNPSGYIVDTMRAVFQAFFDTDSFEDALIDVVNRGGDADTTGAITGMLAGACYGMEAIPKRWLEKLDPTIRQICEYQAEALLTCAIQHSVL